MLPFTRLQFFDLFATYNSAIWPLQLVAYIAGICALALVFREGRGASVAIAITLAAFWAVNGAGYHWAFFAGINPLARAFALLFIVQAGLLVILPLQDQSFRFAWAGDATSILGGALAVFALAGYPLWGWLAGHQWPAVPMFGVAPCPTTIFTIGLLLMAEGRTRNWLLAIPLIWAAIGGSAAVLLGVPEDYGLLAALVVAVAVLSLAHRGGHRHA